MGWAGSSARPDQAPSARIWGSASPKAREVFRIAGTASVSSFPALLSPWGVLVLPQGGHPRYTLNGRRTCLRLSHAEDILLTVNSPEQALAIKCEVYFLDTPALQVQPDTWEFYYKKQHTIEVTI